MVETKIGSIVYIFILSDYYKQHQSLVLVKRYMVHGVVNGTWCGTWYMVCRVVHVTGEMVVGGPGVAWQPLNLRPHCLAQGHQKPHRHPKSENLGR